MLRRLHRLGVSVIAHRAPRSYIVPPASPVVITRADGSVIVKPPRTPLVRRGVRGSQWKIAAPTPAPRRVGWLGGMPSGIGHQGAAVVAALLAVTMR